MVEERPILDGLQHVEVVAYGLVQDTVDNKADSMPSFATDLMPDAQATECRSSACVQQCRMGVFPIFQMIE